MSGFITKTLVPIILTFLLFFPLVIQAQNNPAPTSNNTSSQKNYISNLEKFSEKAGFSSQQKSDGSIAKTIGRMASVVISFVGTIFIIINVYSGIQWMTSGGSEKKIDEAKTRIINATAGLILLALAYILTKLVTTFLG